MPLPMNNPFHSHKADDTLRLPLGHLPELHGRVVARWNAAVEQARRTQQSVGLLLQGEAGSGKSHLIAQFRQQLAGDPRAVLACIRMGKGHTGRLWRHLRERLVDDLLRPYPDTRHGVHGLQRILRNRFVGDPAVGLEVFARSTSLDYGLLQVLPQALGPTVPINVRAWLEGKQLGERQLQALGLPPVYASEQEQENQAQDVVCSLLKLAGDSTLLVLCFDEVEAIQGGTYDALALRAFATLVTQVLAEPGPRVVVTSIRGIVQLELQKSVETSNLQKLAQLTATIPPLTQEQAFDLARARLLAEPSCREERRGFPEESLWPLEASFVRQLWSQHSRHLTPRQLIMACQVEFDRLHQMAAANDTQIHQPVAQAVTRPTPGKTELPAKTELPGKTENATPVPTTPLRPSPDFFQPVWERLCKRFVEQPLTINFEVTLALGLPWWVEATHRPFRRVAVPRTLGDVTLLFQPTGSSRCGLGVALANHSPQPLYHLLGRLIRQWKSGQGQTLQSLTILRASATRTTQASQERLDELLQAGVQVRLLDQELLAELAAYQMLFTNAQRGILVRRNGRIVTLEEYNPWVEKHLGEGVHTLLDQILPLGAAVGQGVLEGVEA